MFKQNCCILFILIVSISLNACGSNLSSGQFKVVDGKEIFMNGKNQIIDKLVEVDGEKYYVGIDGTKIKNDWVVIDNDGNYAYFGAKGQMVKDQVKEIAGKYYLFKKDGTLEKSGKFDYNGNTYYVTNDGSLISEGIKTIEGKDYYFDKEGKLVVKEGWVVNNSGDYAQGSYYLDKNGQRVKATWQGNYYLDNDGRMVTNQWVGEYYVGNDGAYLTNTTTPDGKQVGVDGKVLLKSVTSVANAINNVSNVISNSTGLSNTIGGVIGSAITNEVVDSLTTTLSKDGKELWIEKNDRKNFEVEYSWSSEDGEYESERATVIFDMPIVGGVNKDEVEAYNKQISNITEQFIEDIKNGEAILCNDDPEHKHYNGAITSLKFLGKDQDFRWGEFLTGTDAGITLKLQYDYIDGEGKKKSQELINMHEFHFDRKNKVVDFTIDNTYEVLSPLYRLNKTYVEE